METKSAPSWYQYLFLIAGVACSVFVWNMWRENRTEARPLDPARDQAWQKLSARLQKAEKGDLDASARYAQRISAFFADKRRHAPMFAEDVISWGGKWEWLKAKFANDGDHAYHGYLRDTFQQHFFTEHDLKAHVEQTIVAYLSELEGRENALLVEIRADLNTQDLPQWRAIAASKTDEAFRKETHHLIEEVAPTVGTDLKVSIGREIVVNVGTDIATAATVRLGSAVATQLGVSTGILGSGAVSGVATFGLGLIVGFIVDSIVDRLMREAGYDPAGQIANQAVDSLRRVEFALLEGDVQAREACRELRKLQAKDPFLFVREEAGRNANRIDATCKMGLRHELERLAHVRGQLRTAALKKMILQGGQP